METVLLHKSAFLYVTSIFRLSSFVFANALLTGITKTFVPFYSSFPEIFANFGKIGYRKYGENGMTKEEDQKICDLLRSRNKKGLDLLFQVYYTSLVLWANTFLNSLPAAEDLVQEFFITVWKDRFYEKFQAHHLSSFLRIVVKNRALNKLEKRDVLQSVTGLEHIELAWEEYNDRHDRIVSAVQKEILLLPPRSREIMLLVFQQGMKYQEVAKQLNISLSTVKNLVAKSVEKLRERLNDEALIYFFCIFPKRLKNK